MRKTLFVLIILLFAPVSASAASATLQATPTRVGVGDVVRVDVLLGSAIPVNAFSGELQYSSALQPMAVIDGNSIISIWITRPTLLPDQPISFAGITPGGYSGDDGVLLSILFKVTSQGVAKIALENMKVLRNDGEGRDEPTETHPLTFSVGSGAIGGYTETTDQVPPEPFTAFIGTDTQLFENKAYLVFSTLDKGSGVDHYAVAESRVPFSLQALFPLVWRDTTSPYVLVDQNFTNAVYLKAVDRAGNERLSIYPPQRLLTGYEKGVVLAILILVAFLLYIRRRRRF